MQLCQHFHCADDGISRTGIGEPEDGRGFAGGKGFRPGDQEKAEAILKVRMECICQTAQHPATENDNAVLAFRKGSADGTAGHAGAKNGIPGGNQQAGKLCPAGF
jgi:hypothetical protein